MSSIDSAPIEWVEIGRIVAPQGVRGEVRVYPDSDFPERFLTPGDRWLRRTATSEPEAVTLVSGRFLAGKGLYALRLAGINTREQAEALRDAVLLVAAGDRPTLDPNEFYVRDLLGLEVRLQEEATPVGTVVDVFSAGNDLLAVALNPAFTQQGSPKAAKAQPVLVPLVPEIVPVVNLAGGYVEITPPPGLLTL